MSATEGEEAQKSTDKLKQFLTLDGLTIFLLNYLKEAKFDFIHLQVGQNLVAFLQELKLTVGDAHKLTEEQIPAFAKLFKEWSGDAIIRGIVSSPESYGINSEVLDIVQDALLKVLLRKPPADSGFVQSKVDQISSKIKLVPLSEAIHEEDIFEE